MLLVKAEFFEDRHSPPVLANSPQQLHHQAGPSGNATEHGPTFHVVSGRKRSSHEQRFSDSAPLRSTRRELFSPSQHLSPQTSVAAHLSCMHPPQHLPRPLFTEGHTRHGSSQAAAPIGHAPRTAPVLHPAPDPCSALLGSSSAVLSHRLLSNNLSPSTTATGQQLLNLEVQLQALLGIRSDEEGGNNICWVDSGILNYVQGVLHFHRIYGDAECAQVMTCMRFLPQSQLLRHCLFLNISAQYT